MQSRYYDPEIGRFINADGFTSTGQGFTGNNMFAYCGNNPVINADPSGLLHEMHAGGGGKPTIIYHDYILKQTDPDVADKKLGVATVSHSGCGVVATYNALYSLGEPRSFNSILRHYNRADDALLLLGLLGMSPDAIADFFIEAGYGVCMTNNPVTMDALSKLASANILYYMFTYTNESGTKSIGHHFVEYHSTSSGIYEAVNAGTPTGFDYFTSPGHFATDNSIVYVGIYIF